MTCQQARNLISAQMDDAQVASEGAALQQHLTGCSACRAVASALAQQHADLESLFVERRRRAGGVAQAALAQLRSQRPWPVAGWIKMLAAAAAGFLLAILVFHPWRQPASQVAQPPPLAPSSAPAGIGHLALATGPIEFLAAGRQQWQVMSTDGVLLPQTRVRTGAASRCEFTMADGSEVRLNANSELAFGAARSMQLVSGQVWSSVMPAPVPFQVVAADATMTALGTQFDVLAQAQQATLTVVQGAVQVSGGGGQTLVKSGQRAHIERGKVNEKQEVRDLELAVSWANELLVRKGRDNAELAQRVNGLLAQIGQTKMEELYDQEIRALGDHCVLPLTRYVQSEQSRQPREQPRRVRAARILADLAQPWSIGDLIGLLRDNNPDVRYSAAKGLKRLTGLEQGCSPEQWRDQAAAAESSLQRWQAWWQVNQGRYAVPATSSR